MFYLAPFVVVSIVVGIVLRMAGAPRDGVASLSSSKAVVTAYAVMLCLVGLVFFQNLDRAKVFLSKKAGQALWDQGGASRIRDFYSEICCLWRDRCRMGRLTRDVFWRGFSVAK